MKKPVPKDWKSNQAEHEIDRNAHWFALVNVLILSFGCWRVSTVGNDNNDTTREKFVLAANSFQVIFSSLSLVAIAGHLFSPMTRMPVGVVKAAVIGAIPLAWFVFVIHLWDMSVGVQNASGNNKAGAVFGLIGFIANCAALFGSQTFFGLQVVKAHEVKHDTSAWFRKRQIYYAFLYILFAIGTLGAGIVVMNNNNGYSGNVVAYRSQWTIPNGAGGVIPEGEGEAEGEGEGEGEGESEGEPESGRILTAPRLRYRDLQSTPEGEGEGESEGEGEAEGEGEGAAEGEGEAEGTGTAALGAAQYGPYNVAVPGLNITLGVLMIIWGFVHILKSMSDSLSIPYLAGSLFLWVFQVVVQSMANTSITGNGTAAMIVCMMTFPIAIMPVYCDIYACTSAASSKHNQVLEDSQQNNQTSADAKTVAQT